MTIERITKYGAEVWSNTEMDELRPAECLCLHCAAGPYANRVCVSRAILYEACQRFNMALMVTRCQLFRPKEQ